MADTRDGGEQEPGEDLDYVHEAANDANRALGAIGGAILCLELHGDRDDMVAQLRAGYAEVAAVYRRLVLEEDPEFDAKLAAVLRGVPYEPPAGR